MLRAVLLAALALSCRAEVFTALADMEELFETEAVLMDSLEQYIAAQEEKVASLKGLLAVFVREHEEGSRDAQAYLSNPISAYRLVKRLSSDWRRAEADMTAQPGAEVLASLAQRRAALTFPTDEDLAGAATALMRLQDTYKLETASVARGELNGVQYSAELSAGDCFELGRLSYNNGDFYHTVLWMTETLARHEEEANGTTTKVDILDYLAFSTYMEGNVARAMQLNEQLLEIEPRHTRALGNRLNYQAELEKARGGKNSLGDEGSDPPKKKTFVDEGLPLSERDTYERLCRGDLQLEPSAQARLHCRYVDKGSPFLRLARLREEEAFLSPRIVLYHDVISPREIETITAMARPRFQRATVQNYKTGELETASYRISKSSWLKESEHPTVAAVSRRAGFISGLETSTAEELQVVNYGIGGHYEPHFDFARKEEEKAFKNLNTGNRIATVLYYMSDVAQGGATVFPQLKVALFPKRGAAAFWFNLHADGSGDTRTRHAACPVLTGSKWVSNKWFHEKGQEFLRPCGPTEDFEAA